MKQYLTTKPKTTPVLDLGFHIRIERELTIAEITDENGREIALKNLDEDTTLLATIRDENQAKPTAELQVYNPQKPDEGLPLRLWHYDAQLSRVIDGDTIDAVIELGFGLKLTERLRLAGIQAPEIFGIPAHDPEFKKGMQAKKFLQEKLQDTPFRIRTEKRGKWRRWLADIYLPNSDTTLNQELINQNLAYDWQTYQKKQQEKATVRTMFEIDRSLRSELESRAKEKNISVSELIRLAIEKFME
jgi:micrococcal nuclease